MPMHTETIQRKEKNRDKVMWQKPGHFGECLRAAGKLQAFKDMEDSATAV